MWRRVVQSMGKTGAAAVTGAGFQQAVGGENNGQTSSGLEWGTTGRSYFQARTENMRLGSDQNPAVAGLHDQGRKRFDMVEIVSRFDPACAKENLSRVPEKLDSAMELARGLKVVLEKGLTKDDCKALTYAAFQQGKQSASDLAKGTFAAMTTSTGDVEELAKAARDRVTHDAEALAVGLVASQGIASALRQFPHPLAKVTAALIQTTGQMATGARMSEHVQEASDVSPFVRGALAQIAREKSAQSSSKPSDGGSTR